jgi:hypothetical protein
MTHRYLTALEAFEDILQVDSSLLFQVLQKVMIYLSFCLYLTFDESILNVYLFIFRCLHL